MKDKQRRFGTSLQKPLETKEVLHRICAIVAASGNYVMETKILRATVLALQDNYKHFLPLRFDARFFSLMSSKVEQALSLGHELGYIFECYHTRDREPIHSTRKLNTFGEREANIIFENGKSFGIADVSDFVGDVLSITALPTNFTIGYGLYRTYVDNGDLDISVEESSAPPYKICHRLNPATVYEVEKDLRDKFDWLITDLEIKPHPSDSYEIFFALSPENVQKRYWYLKFTKDQLTSHVKEVEEVSKGDKKDWRSYLIDQTTADLTEELASSRRKAIDSLIERYPKLLERYLLHLKHRLNKLEENYDHIMKWYEHVFSVHKKIAQLSTLYWNSPEDRLRNKLTLEAHSTKSEIIIPEKIKQEIRGSTYDGVWHYGGDYYVNHIPQFDIRVVLADIHYGKEYLMASMKQ